jgi:Uma2 family endonuclease
MSVHTLEAFEARSAPKITSTPIVKKINLNEEEPTFPELEFPYGWRYVTQTFENGETTIKQIPLTDSDILDPQLGDQMPQRPRHAQCSIDLYNMLEVHYHENPNVGVYYDYKMKWGIAGLSEPAPDVAIIPNVKDKNADHIGSFDVKKEGTLPCLVIEIMSPDYPHDDTKKVHIYEQAGVKEYLIINPHSEQATPYYEIWGYRLQKGQYKRIKPNTDGEIFSQTTQLWFGVEDDKSRLKLKDAVTDQRLLTAKEAQAALLEAETQTQQEQAARLEAETKAQAEVMARLEAETKAQAEVMARLKEQSARLEAEKQAQSEAKKRAELEKRLRELEARLN